MKKQVLVPVADGTEDLEAVAVIDILRRAGADVTIASVTGNTGVTCSQGIRITADRLISECLNQTFDLVVLPGGIPGVDNLKQSSELASILLKQEQDGRLFGAICAAPAVVLESQGLLAGRLATCHPGFADRMTNRDTTGSRVVVDRNCITSRGAGTAIDFGLALVENLFGSEKRNEVEKGLAIPEAS